MKRVSEVIGVEKLPCRYQVYSKAKKEMVWTKPGVDCGGDFCIRCQRQDCGNCAHNDCASCGWNLNEAMRRASVGRFESRPKLVDGKVLEIRTLHFGGNPTKAKGEYGDGNSGEGSA